MSSTATIISTANYTNYFYLMADLAHKMILLGFCQKWQANTLYDFEQQVYLFPKHCFILVYPKDGVLYTICF